MDRDQFDALTRLLAGRGSRRGALAALLGGGFAGAAITGEAKKGKNRRRRGHRRRGRGKGTRVCFKGRTLVVDRASARELVSRGGTFGRCRPPGMPGEPGEPQTCTGASPFCGANMTSCGPAQSQCVCLSTTSGGSVCALDQSVCAADESTCMVDQDCVNRFGSGFACVSTAACSGLHCGGNGNACVPSCVACIPVGGACGTGVSGSCCEGAVCNDGVCRDISPPELVSCSAADPTCPPCQVCVENAVCQPVPNGLLACDGSFLNPQTACTQEPGTGVCQDGACNCGPGGEYDRANNTCVCNAATTEQCQGCCQISFVCADGTALATCGTCATS